MEHQCGIRGFLKISRKRAALRDVLTPAQASLTQSWNIQVQGSRYLISNPILCVIHLVLPASFLSQYSMDFSIILRCSGMMLLLALPFRERLWGIAECQVFF